MPEVLPLLRLESATLRTTGRSLLAPVTLDLAVGERLCVTGPAASGKSLLLEVMAGRHTLSAGHRSYPAFAAWHADSTLGVAPRFAARLVSTEEQRRLATQVASFHQARWHAQFSEPDTVEAFLEARRVVGLNEFEEPPEGLLSPTHDARRLELMQQLGIEHLFARRVAALSNGEMRKLLILRAILARPRLLLLDDPLGGLDPDARPKVIGTLARWCGSAATTAGDHPTRNAWLGPREAVTLVIATPRPDELEQLTARTFQLESTRVSVPSKNREEAFSVKTFGAAAAERPPEKGNWAAVSRGDTQEFVPNRTGSTLVKLNHATVAVPGTKILDGVSFEVRVGEHWLITGPNGSGKSTLLALLLGDHPQSYVVDLEVLGTRAGPGVSRFERQRRVGFMAPELAMHYPPGWTVRDVVLSGFMATIGQFGEARKIDRELAESWTSYLDLEPCVNTPFGLLSEAEQRRTLLARALVRSPTLLFLDEPTQGLSRSERVKLHQLLDAITLQSQVTLLLVSHHPEERPRCISHHLALKLGRIEFQGPLTA